jgi:hypothetical protein
VHDEWRGPLIWLTTALAAVFSAACDEAPGDGLLRAQDAKAFAGEVVTGRVPSGRDPHARLYGGQSRAQRVRIPRCGHQQYEERNSQPASSG